MVYWGYIKEYKCQRQSMSTVQGAKKTSDNFTEYKRLRNKTDALKKAKKDFVKNKITENKSCPKQLWKTLTKCGFPTKVNTASSNIGLTNEDDDVCFDSDFVANTHLIAISAISQINWLIDSL